jgi:hypothetical protein
MRSLWIGSLCAVALGVTLASQEWQPRRTPDGQPDISGIVWTTGPDEVAYTGDLETGVADAVGRKVQGRGIPKGGSLIVDPKNGLIPYQPWAQARREQIPHGRVAPQIGRKVVDREPTKLREVRPQYMCLPAAPRINFDRDFHFVQTPGYVVMMWEWSHAYRVIPLDGRPRLSPRVKMAMGDARGRWEGNTLVVETTNINDWDWLDAAASFHSDAMTAVERYTILDANTIDYRVTIADPKVFTQPWTAAFKMRRSHDPGYEIIEAACVEGERAVTNILGDADWRRP